MGCSSSILQRISWYRAWKILSLKSYFLIIWIVWMMNTVGTLHWSRITLRFEGEMLKNNWQKKRLNYYILEGNVIFRHRNNLSLQATHRIIECSNWEMSALQLTPFIKLFLMQISSSLLNSNLLVVRISL